MSAVHPTSDVSRLAELGPWTFSNCTWELLIHYPSDCPVPSQCKTSPHLHAGALLSRTSPPDTVRQRLMVSTHMSAIWPFMPPLGLMVSAQPPSSPSGLRVSDDPGWAHRSPFLQPCHESPPAFCTNSATHDITIACCLDCRLAPAHNITPATHFIIRPNGQPLASCARFWPR